MTRTKHLQPTMPDADSQQFSTARGDEYHTAGEVRLSDGRLARLRDPDPVADRRSDLLLLQARIFRGGRLDPIEGASFRCVLAIATMDGEPVPWPPVRPTREALRAYIARFSKADIEVLAQCYDRLNDGAHTRLLRFERQGRVA